MRRAKIDAAAVERHHKGVWRYLRFLGAAPGLADDLTQEAFLVALRSPPVDQGPSALAGWLRRTALNLFRSHGRAARPGVPLNDPAALEAAWRRGAGDDDGEDWLAALRACTRGLTERQRRALDLRYRARAGMAEIAAALGLEPGGAKTLLRRTRDRLRDCVTRRLDHG